MSHRNYISPTDLALSIIKIQIQPFVNYDANSYYKNGYHQYCGQD